MGLVQVLPEWLWSRTALAQVTKGQMVGFTPGQPSQSLSFTSRGRWRRHPPVGVKVPVMTLEPSVTARWSQMVAGKTSVTAPGLIFTPVTVRQMLPYEERDNQRQAEAIQDPQERLEQFRNFSSPIARRLAGLLAACPEINLPVIRMVQDAMLRESQQVHVAEVLLGGLFKPQTEITAHTPADDVQYVFHEGVQPLVLDTVPAQETFNALSTWVQRRFNCALEDFIAYILPEDSDQVKPFAGVMLDVLRRQGSQKYAEIAARIESIYQPRYRGVRFESDWDLKLCLINYRSQVQDLEDLLAKAELFQAKAPLIVFAFGNDRLVDSFTVLVERFEKQIIPYRYKSELLAPARYLDWPNVGGEVDRGFRALADKLEQELAMEIAISELDSDEAPKTVCQEINKQRCIQIFYTVLRDPDLRGSDAWLMDKWLNFWAQVSRYELRYLTILFMYLSYSEKGLLGKFFGHRQTRKRIDEFLLLQSERFKSVVPESNRALKIRVLEELTPFTRKDVEEWLEQIFSRSSAKKKIMLKRKVIDQFDPNKTITMGEFIDRLSTVDLENWTKEL